MEGHLSDFFQYYIPRVLLAVVCGAVVGLERNLKNKPAGIKTNILICLGSALYASVSVALMQQYGNEHRAPDPGRIVAQIVSGIGFIGGGTIIQARGAIFGLTTAALIWVVAAIGIAIGFGYFTLSGLSTIVVVAVMTASTWFEDNVLGRAAIYAIEIEASGDVSAFHQRVHELLENCDLLLQDYKRTQNKDKTLFRISYMGQRKNHRKFQLDLWGISSVTDVKEI